MADSTFKPAPQPIRWSPEFKDTDTMGAPIAKGDVDVTTYEYEFAHGRGPRGYGGGWAFEFEGDPVKVRFLSGGYHYTAAKKIAVAEAAKRGIYRVNVAT